MTNHGETTGPSENGDIGASGAHRAPAADGRGSGRETGQGSGGVSGPGSGQASGQGSGRDSAQGTGQEKPADHPGGTRVPGQAYGSHGGEHQVTLRTPAELADALPYLLGYRPEDSIVLVALHDKDGRGRFGGRARLGIPAHEDDWPSAARQLAHGLVKGSERRGARPQSMVAFLCQEPEKGRTGREVMERLRPLAQRLRVECGSLDVVVVEALCISEGRYWSYCCDNPVCCSPEGAPMGLPGTSVLAAAAAYAGIQVRGTLKELRARLQPWEIAAALDQETALDTASMALVPRILDEAGRAEVADETLELARMMLDRLAGAEPVSGTLLADLRDDELIGHEEAARLILGLQDRSTRDRAAEWMEGDEAALALRLWRTLARRCVGPYGEHAAAPLTLAGWVAWSTGDELEAREALALALGADPDYLFARLLHQACNEGLEPESIRRCLRAERAERVGRGRARAEAPEVAARAEGLPAGEAGSVIEAAGGARATGSAATEAQAVDAEAGADASDTEEVPSRAHSVPSPSTAHLRRRRRPRSAGASHRRTPTGLPRPAGAADAVTRPGRAASRNGGRPGTARVDGTRARGSHEAVLPSRDMGQEATRPDRSAEGEE
ncbi:DUF4192 family protein [Streptomyces sp. NPDC093516]|uniref:DUF4192 domain-containing protein n=1 Tax=Streptomyces sp. NPDC093516 TaxID=3155304 RepID=UPI0034139561